MFSEMLILKQKIMRNLFLVLFFLSTITCIGSDLYVFPGASLPNYSNIQSAIDDASSGDNIIVATASYSGDVVINKSITISAMTDNYTIQGGLLLHLDYQGNFVVNIKNVDLLGNLTTVGGNNDNTVYELNIIDSSITGNVSLNVSSVTLNAYFTEFYSNFSVFNSRHIISNIFGDSSDQLQNITIYFYTLNTPFGNNSNSGTENPTLKIINNQFNSRALEFRPEPYNNEIVPKIIIANNFFIYPPDFSNKQIRYDGSHGNLNILNNTFIYNNENGIHDASSNYYSWGYVIESDAIVTEIINNLFFVPGAFGSGYATSFNFPSGSEVLIFKNNANPHNQSDQFNELPASIIIEDNYWNSGANALDLNEYGGMFNSNDNINMGSQEIQYQDIDNSINDLGTWGGPYSYENYNKSTLLGKAQIFDLEIPSSIYALPGVNVNIKAKGVISN
jgi:hypothetical protein